MWWIGVWQWNCHRMSSNLAACCWFPRKFIDSCGSCRVGMGYLQGVTPSLPRTLGTLRWGRDLQSNLTTMAGGTWCHSLRASLAGSTSGRLRVTRQIASSQAQSIRLGMDCHLSCLFFGGDEHGWTPIYIIYHHIHPTKTSNSLELLMAKMFFLVHQGAGGFDHVGRLCGVGNTFISRLTNN